MMLNATEQQHNQLRLLHSLFQDNHTFQQKNVENVVSPPQKTEFQKQQFVFTHPVLLRLSNYNTYQYSTKNIN